MENNMTQKQALMELLKRIKKYKAQKKSQYYFEVEYNNASLLERMLLKLTAWLSQIILSIGYFIQDLLRK